MILIPDMQGCTIITDDGYCTIPGLPQDIVHSVFIDEVQISDNMTLIRPIVKEITVVSGSIASDLYCNILKKENIAVKTIFPQKLTTLLKGLHEDGETNG